jgi:hypothetical protein
MYVKKQWCFATKSTLKIIKNFEKNKSILKMKIDQKINM